MLISLSRSFVCGLQTAIPCTDSNSTRYALSGVSLVLQPNGIAELCGTDGKRMAIVSDLHYRLIEGTITEPVQLVFEADQLKALVKTTGACDVELTIDGLNWSVMTYTGKVASKAKRVELSGRFIQGRFPNYRDVIPERSSAIARIESPVSEMIDWINPQPIRTFHLNGSASCEFQSIAGQTANPRKRTSEKPHRFKYTGEVKIDLNVEYCLDWLQTVNYENADCNWFFIDSDSPALAEANVFGCLARFIVMPCV